MDDVWSRRRRTKERRKDSREVSEGAEKSQFSLAVKPIDDI